MIRPRILSFVSMMTIVLRSTKFSSSLLQPMTTLSNKIPIKTIYSCRIDQFHNRFINKNDQQFYTRRHINNNGKNLSSNIKATTLSIEETEGLGELSRIGEFIIQWRGEGTKGYSLQFRHLEFTNAYNAVQLQERNNDENDSNELSPSFQFDDATPTTDELDDLFGAMQFINVLPHDHEKSTLSTTKSSNTKNMINKEILVKSSVRCSLIRHVYQIVGQGDTFEELANSAIEHNLLNDLITPSSPLSWCLRLREYGTDTDKTKRYGTRKRNSMTKERVALSAMATNLLSKFTGSVKLSNPDCPLYVFEGLNNGIDGKRGMKKYTLVRGVATGPQTSIIAPNSRKCITRTPLCPIAAFLLCNLAKVKDGDCILDPFAGSCTTLLAATMVANDTTTVGVEIASDKVVNRNDIMLDFTSRGLLCPESLIEGDITVAKIRDEARRAIGDKSNRKSFDVVLADPPYGIREAMGDSDESIDDELATPLVRLVQCIAEDRLSGKHLIKKGGRLVAFVPILTGEELKDALPSDTLLKKAGLNFVDIREQPLSETLSRWLVIYESNTK